VTYSSVVKVAAKMTAGSISVYPNPVEGKIAQVIFTDQKEGNYTLQFISNSGQVIWSGKIKISASNEVIPVALPSTTAAGVYQLVVVSENGKKMNTQVLIKN
jgi:hypothetical protein